jgi:hypothetical protein
MVIARNLIVHWLARLAGLMFIAAWFAAPAQAGSGTVGDPYTSLSEAYGAPSSGRYFFNLGSGIFQADIDVGEGGGWVLVVQYVHQGGTNPPLSILGAGANLPETSTAPLGTNESGIPARWGHAGNAAMNQFAGDIETRWFAQTSAHSRTIHFRTSVGDEYFRTGTGSMSGVNTAFTALTGHNAGIPASAGNNYSDQGDYAFTNFPFWQGGVRHWGIAGANIGANPATSGFRWEVDDFPASSANSTIHKVWVRQANPGLVLNTNDSGPGSLRDAISWANSRTGADTITFNIPGTGPHTIALTSSLPDITDAGLTIDGTTQSGSACGQLGAGTPHNLQIFINGNNTATNAFNIFAPDTTLRGMAVGNFIEKGFWVVSTSGALIECNYWGVRPNGVTPAPLVTGGLTGPVQFQSATNSVFSNNLVSGNNAQTNDVGLIVSDASNGIVISGNNFGLNATASAALGNAATGLRVSDSDTVTIGGTTAADRNIFGGNGADGVWILRSFLVDVIGNYVGLSANGTTALGNAGTGIRIEDSDNLTLGDGTVAGRNVIGGNGSRAIFASRTTSGVTINGNYIGTDATGNAAVANGWNEGGTVRDAIAFASAGTYSNIAVLNNVVGGYGGALIEVWSSTATGITIQGNSLGVGASGVSPIVAGNVEELIHIGGATPGSYSDFLIGGSEPGQGNLLANGGRAGILLFSNGTNIRVIGNTIRDNAAQGIRLPSPTMASVLGNNIYANGGLGIDLNDDGVTLNDPGDGDSGANNLLNFPVFTALNSAAGGQLAYAFTLDVPAESNGYRIDFFRNSSPDPTGFGEGEEWLGFIDTPAHGSGAVAFNGTFTPLAPVSTGALVSATATRKTGPATYAETSEFNQNATIVTPLVVTNTDDAGAGSLRNAIDFANSDPAQDAITFNIPGSGVQTITLASVLPALTDDGISIDGTTQPGAACGDLWAGTPHTLLIRLDGVNRSFIGINSAGANQIIRGLSLTNFADGVRGSSTSSNAVIRCNYIGLAPDGTSAGNDRGVRTFGSNTLIGGLDADEGNVISGNTRTGLSSGNTASAMAVRGNFIGTDPLGTAAQANEVFTISNQSGTASWSDVTRNLISGNAGNGIDLQGDDTVTASGSTISIAGNFIGVDRTGTAALPNNGSGIDLILGTISNVTIGGTSAADRNIISGNGARGIQIGAQDGVSILGNTIGLAADGATAIANGANGIRLEATSNVQIGNDTGTGRNIISGNNAPGIAIVSGSSGVSIRGNYVGTDSTGLVSVRNLDAGIVIDQSSNITIGNGTAGGRNVLSGNNVRGALIRNGSSSVSMLGNYIGVGADGSTRVANSRNGIELLDVSNVQIGDGTAGGRNIVSGNGSGGAFDHGLFLASTTNLTFAGNYIGVAADGSTMLGNTRNGLMFQSLADQTGHTNTLITGNVISGNGLGGVDISSFSGSALGAPATITFTGNKIGVAADGVTPAGNVAFGIKNTNVPGQIIIGGIASGDANIIAHNGAEAVIAESLPLNVAVIGNSIYSNGGIGIDLGRDGVTPNDAGDGDTGSNDLLNFPQDIRAIAADANTLNYSLTLDAPAAASGYRVEFFANDTANPSGHGEGQRYLGHVDISHGGGAQSYTGTLATLQPIVIGSIISTTATRRTAGGSWDITSEFSAVATADGVAQMTVEITSAVFDAVTGDAFAAPGSDMRLTATFTNTGSGSTDADTLFAVLTINQDTRFLNDVTPELGGVVGFSSGTPSLSFTPPTDLRFSNDVAAPSSLGDCNYTPTSGYDPEVRHVCLNPKGSLPAGAPDGKFAVSVIVKIN